jgi:tetrahydromethanopterin S-methyltransferase subunit G
MEPVALLAGQITLIGGGIAFAFGVLFSIWKFSIAWNDFMRDWKGTDFSDGRASTTGVISRLENLEKGLKTVNAEVKPNGGKSIKDVVNRIETRLEEGNEMFDSLDTRIDRIERRIDL